jgi:hypothetical protein
VASAPGPAAALGRLSAARWRAYGPNRLPGRGVPPPTSTLTGAGRRGVDRSARLLGAGEVGLAPSGTQRASSVSPIGARPSHAAPRKGCAMVYPVRPAWKASTTFAGSRPRSATAYPFSLAQERSSALLTDPVPRRGERRVELVGDVRVGVARRPPARRRGLAEPARPAEEFGSGAASTFVVETTSVTSYMAPSTRTAFSSGSLESSVTCTVALPFRTRSGIPSRGKE